MTNNNPNIEDFLKSHGLRLTPIRKELLKVFFTYDYALSLGEIKDYLNIDYDRVTLYRALNTFIDKGLLHLVPDSSHGNKYALCSDSCPHTAHQESHVHFICRKCQKTFCLDDVKVPSIKLSSDFSVEGFDYTVSGVCDKCK